MISACGTSHAGHRPQLGCRVLLIAGWLLLFSIAASPEGVAAEVVVLPNPETALVQHASLASDGARLITFYCHQVTSGFNTYNVGTAKEWDGSTWVELPVSPPFSCHDPDIAIWGNSVVVVSNDDQGHGHWMSNTDDPTQWKSGPLSGTYTNSAPRAAFAFGAPYGAMTMLNLGGMTKLYVTCLTSVCNALPDYLGGYRYFSGIDSSVGAVSITGDDNALYAVFTSPFVPMTFGYGCVNVQRWTRSTGSLGEYLGSCLSSSTYNPSSPEVAIVAGQPVVAFLEGNAAYLNVFRWDGSNWISIKGKNPPRGATFGRLRAEGAGANLYLAYQVSGQPSQIVVERWDGSTWSTLPDPLQPFSGTTIELWDLAVYQGQPYLAISVDGALRVVKLGSPQSPITGDFTGDGKPDLLWQHATSGDVYLWYMNGSTQTGGAYLAHGMGAWKVVATADFTGDGKPDLLWQHATSGDVYLWTMNGTAQTSGAYLAQGMGSWEVVATGDFCGNDGKPDLVWQHATTGDVYLWCMNGTTMTSGTYLAQGMGSWKVVGAADLTGDGRPDLLWQHATSGDVYLWTMNGTTVTGGTYLAHSMAPWKVVGAVDLTGDGKPDLLWQHATSGDVYLWTMNGMTQTGGAYLAHGMGPWKVVGPK